MHFSWRITLVAITLSFVGVAALAGPTWANEKSDKEIIHLQNPLASKDVTTIAGRAIFAAMGIMGSLALVVFVYGGFRWLTAAGNSESVTAGTQAMVWAAIGIFIIFSSYAILQLVFKGIGVAEENVIPPKVVLGCCLLPTAKADIFTAKSAVPEKECKLISQSAAWDPSDSFCDKVKKEGATEPLGCCSTVFLTGAAKSTPNTYESSCTIDKTGAAKATWDGTKPECK